MPVACAPMWTPVVCEPTWHASVPFFVGETMVVGDTVYVVGGVASSGTEPVVEAFRAT